MLHLCDVPVSDAAAGTLIDLLHGSGRADDLSAATIIQNALSRKALSAPLTPDEREGSNPSWLIFFAEVVQW